MLTGFNKLWGRFRFLCIPLSRSWSIFPAPSFTYAFNFPQAAVGGGFVCAAVGTRQKPKIIRPTSCQVLLGRINHRARRSQDSLAASAAAGSSVQSRPRVAARIRAVTPAPRSAFRCCFVPGRAAPRSSHLRHRAAPPQPHPGLGGGLCFRGRDPPPLPLRPKCPRHPGSGPAGCEECRSPEGIVLLPRATKGLGTALYCS